MQACRSSSTSIVSLVRVSLYCGLEFTRRNETQGKRPPIRHRWHLDEVQARLLQRRAGGGAVHLHEGLQGELGLPERGEPMLVVKHGTAFRIRMRIRPPGFLWRFLWR